MRSRSASKRPIVCFSQLCILSAFVAIFILSFASTAHTEPKDRIAFVGDSMSDGYWNGLARAVDQNACLKGVFELGRHGRDSSGLVRSVGIDWPTELRRIGARFRPQLFIMSVGTNDLGSDDKYYKDRITEVLESVVASRAGLLWIGLPAMRPAPNDRDARYKNRLFEQTIGEFGNENIEFVEPWRLNGTDKFMSFGPDTTGKVVQIRTPDGIHFTYAGDLITGIYLLPKVMARFPRSTELCGNNQAHAQ